MPSRHQIANVFGLIALLALPLCFFGATPVWAWVVLVFIPALLWLCISRAFLGAILGAIFGITA